MPWLTGSSVSNSDGDKGYNIDTTQGEGPARRMKGKMLFGVQMSPDISAIAIVYFVQGILGLSRLAVSFFLKDDLQLDPAEVKSPGFCASKFYFDL